MAILPISEAIVRFDQNEDRINKFVNELGTYVPNSGLPDVETLPSFMNRNNQALNLLTATNVKGDWAASTAYSVWDEVKYSSTWYRCVVAHTSTSTFDSTKWRLSQGVSLGQLGANNGAALVGTVNGKTVQQNIESINTNIAVVSTHSDTAAQPSGTNCIVGQSAFQDGALTGTIGYRNTVVGVQAMQNNGSSTSAGGSNCAFGFAALQANIDGSGNNAFGALALNAATGLNTSHNNAFGYQSQSANTSGVQNNSFGFRSLYSLTTGNNNHCFGEGTLYTLPSGNGNHGFGFQSLYNKTSGDFSHAVGYQASFGETTGTLNTTFGYRAGFNMGSAQANTFVGNSVAGNGANQPGNYNTAMGYQALSSMNGVVGTNAQFNSAYGWWSLTRLTTGSSNTAYGQQSGAYITTGGQNVTLGDSAGSGVITSSQNVAVGSGTLANIDGGNNTAIGWNAAAAGSAQTWTNTTSLGANAQPTGSNQVTLGNASVSTIRAAVTTITAISDARDKKDIEDLPLGLDFINAARMRRFKWKMRDGVQRHSDFEAGVIAQELDHLQKDFDCEWLNLVDKSNDNRWEATPMRLVFPLIVAVQELSKKVADLEAKNKVCG